MIGSVNGTGSHIRKRNPSKRIKALHRAADSNTSLRRFARVLERSADSAQAADKANLALDWFANKESR